MHIALTEPADEDLAGQKRVAAAECTECYMHSLPRAQSVVRASLTDPSLSFCSKHTLKRMVLSVRLFVQADLSDLYTI